MYTLGSTEFNQIIETPNNQSIKKRLVLLDNGTIIDKIKSLTLYSSSSSQELQLGTTNMAYIEAEVDSDLLLTNREVRLECGVTLSDGSEEYIPMGVFTIQKPQGDIDFVKFKAHDNMQKFEKVYSSELTYPTTSALVLDEICNMCGVVLSTPIENPIEITEKLQGYTCREVLGFIAGIHGKFACIDRLGTLNLRWYSETPIDKQIGLIWAFNKSDDDFTVDKIEIAKDTETNYTSGSGFSAIYHSNPLATQEIADDLFAKLNGFTYNASTIDILDDIRLDIWDVIRVIYLDGKEYLVPCMSLKQDFGQGSTSIQSFAKSNTENEYRYTGATTNYINRVAMELLLTNRIVATKVDAEYVNSVAITTENFEAKIAIIKDLVVEEIDGKYATIDFANIDIANINKTNIGLLFTEVGLLDRATIVDGHVTGFLDAVEINANKITAGTLMVDRLVFRGSENSIIYQLNNITSKNLIPYPYMETTHTDNGIEWTDLGDGRVVANGLATGTSNFNCRLRSNLTDNNPLILPAGTYTLSGCPSGGTSSTYRIRLGKNDNGTFVSLLGEYGNGATLTLEEETQIQVQCIIASGVNATDLTFEPMLVSGTEKYLFEPFRSRTQALTSETVNGEVLTDRTITADKIIANSITSNEIDVAELFANQAAIVTLIAQDAFIDAIETNRVVVGASDKANEALDKVKKTVKSITMHYLATTASSGVTTSTSGWTTTVQQIDATKKYLWTYQTMTYADNTTTDTSPVISGVYGNEGVDGQPGENGIGVVSVIPLYYLKSDTTTPNAPTTEVTTLSIGTDVWTKSIPIYVSGYTYFTCTQTKYTDGTFSWSTVVADNSLTDAYASLENKANRDEVVVDNLLIYPYLNTTHTDNVITFTDNKDGTIGVSSGTATGACYFFFRSYGATEKTPLTLPKGAYTISGGTSEIFIEVYSVVNNAQGTLLARDKGKGYTFTIEEDTQIMCRITIAKDTVVPETLIKPMLVKGSVAYPYSEYLKSGTGITNNIYREGTTLIDGGKIYTGSITADQIATDAIKSKNYVANTSGSFLNLADGSFDSKYLKWDAQGALTATKGYLGNWEIKDRELQFTVDKQGAFDTEYVGLSLQANIVGDIRQIASLTEMSLWFSLKSDNIDESARYHQYGIETYYGGSDYAYPMTFDYKELLNIGVGYDITQVSSMNGLASMSDVYANYGLDTEVSLLGLQDRMNYLVPHAYSLVTRAELTSSQTVFSVVSGRKFSDYGIVMLTMGANSNEVRAEMTIPRTIFDGTDGNNRTFYLDCWTNNGSTFNQIAVQYVSDTQIKAWLVTASTTIDELNIYGVKTDAGLSGRSGDGL